MRKTLNYILFSTVFFGGGGGLAVARWFRILGLTLTAKKIASSACRFTSLAIDYDIAV